MINEYHLSTRNITGLSELAKWIGSPFYLKLQTVVKSSTSKNLEIVPCNIIFFPSHLCRNVEVVRKPAARVPQAAGLGVSSLPRCSAQSPDEVRGLFAETREILGRRSGVQAIMATSCREFSATLLSESSRALKQGNSFAAAVKSPNRNSMNHSITQSQMTALFALKRNERPPENFMRDFILEFHKRNDATSPKPRRSASAKKSRPT